MKKKLSENYNELYNYTHKRLVFDLCPDMFEKFKMNNFYIDIEELLRYLEKSNCFKSFNQKFFLKFLKWRLAFYILKLFERPIIKTDYESLYKNHPNALGQMIYRYNSKWKELIEIEKAKLLKKEWRKKNIILPFYSVIPKGEMGINPDISFFNIKYDIFKGELGSNNKVILKEKIFLKIKDTLISKKKASVR